MYYAMTTDFVTGKGNPEPYLKRISESKFDRIHWCHHWGDDYLYSKSEMEQIAKWMYDYKLKMYDCHASEGQEKLYYAREKYRRDAGIELVNNRIDFVKYLGAKVIVLHLYTYDDYSNDEDVRKEFYKNTFYSLDKISEYAKKQGIKVAIENLEYNPLKELDEIWSSIFERYPSDVIGLCYDTGHGANTDGETLDILEKYKDRIISLHIHENDGISDLHLIPMTTDVVDWERFAKILASSKYEGPLTLEVSLAPSITHNRRGNDESYFLEKSYQKAVELGYIVDKYRK